MSMRLDVLACIAVAVAGALPEVQLARLPHIGARFSPTPNAREGSGLCMVSPGQMDSCLVVSVKGVTYTIAYRKRSWWKGTVATYIHTVDPEFRLPTGEGVGQILLIAPSQLQVSPGFEIYGAIANERWFPVVGFNGKVTAVSPDGVPTEVNLRTIPKEGKDLPMRLQIVGFTAR